MAFTFTVEDGTVVANANSYVSVEAADDILAVEAYGADAAWQALDPAEKEHRLVAATIWLDDRARWKGALVSKTQALGWPRAHVKDKNGNDVSQVVVPVEVSRAVALLANEFLIKDDSPESFAIPGLRRFRADTFEIDMQAGHYIASTPTFLRFVLQGLGAVLNEPGFKKIVRV